MNKINHRTIPTYVGINNPFLEYENLWVTLSSDRKRVVASGTTIQQLEKKVKRLGNTKVIFTKVIPFDRIYAPNAT